MLLVAELYAGPRSRRTIPAGAIRLPPGDVRVVRAAYVPDDEMVILFLEAPSEVAARTALAAAGLACDRLLPAEA